MSCDVLTSFTGNWRTAVAHIITAVIGNGVLSLGWAIAQASNRMSMYAKIYIPAFAVCFLPLFWPRGCVVRSCMHSMPETDHSSGADWLGMSFLPLPPSPSHKDSKLNATNVTSLIQTCFTLGGTRMHAVADNE